MKRPLDLSSVQAFIRVSELNSFTRAAEAMQITQSAISLKLKRLEERLGCKLLERTPRYVRLSPNGTAFLEQARELLKVHDHACASFTNARQRLSIGISDHVAGPDLPAMIARMNKQDPHLLIEIRIGSTDTLLQSFDQRDLDTVIGRLNSGREDGEYLGEEQFSWFAAAGWQHHADEPLPIATMPEPCGVRFTAKKLLDEACVPWREVFVGGGVTAVSAAVMAGLGVSALATRMVPLGAIDVGPKLGLPKLPRFPIMLHTRIHDGPQRDALATLTAAFKSVAQV